MPSACAIDRRPLWPREPTAQLAPAGARRSRSTSSWTTSTSSGATLKKRAAAEIERPDSFMYVSGLSSATRRLVDPRLGEPPVELRLERRRRADARARRRPSSRRCGGRARARGPGLPRPATSRSSVEADLAPTKEAHELLLGLGALAGVGRRLRLPRRRLPRPRRPRPRRPRLPRPPRARRTRAAPRPSR